MKNKGIFKTVKGRILNILFWSIISAAFIGPGTVTTATKAGADCHFDLLWTLLFATFACVVLQEASARATIYSGVNLGEAIKRHFMGTRMQMPVLVLVVGAIILGCAAYETGNILGSVEGVSLMFPFLDKRIIVAALGLIAGMALAMKSLQSIANFMGAFVFLMGGTFVTVAIMSEPPIGQMAAGLIPSMPDIDGVGMLILGLIGTTIVPYDLFLGSSVVQKETTIKDMRFGVTVSVVLGGLISMAILVVGADMADEAQKYGFSYELLSKTLANHIGSNAVYVFGIGLFAAGFTSAITSPLISALTAQSIFEKPRKNFESHKRNRLYVIVAYSVLAIGLILGFLQIEPIPAIIMAQAFNGMILPFISVFLLTIINDEKIMGKEHVNGAFNNIVMVFVTWITMVLGFVKVVKAFWSIDFVKYVWKTLLGYDVPTTDQLFVMSVIIAIFVTLFVSYSVLKKEQRQKKNLIDN